MPKLEIASHPVARSWRDGKTPAQVTHLHRHVRPRPISGPIFAGEHVVGGRWDDVSYCGERVEVYMDDWPAGHEKDRSKVTCMACLRASDA